METPTEFTEHTELSVVIPTYKDEVDGEHIAYLFAALGYDIEVLVSQDNPHKGKGNALKKGLQEASKEYILIMDADMQIPPAEVDVFFNLMDLYKADAVIGNKRHLYSTTNYTLLRKIISYCYNKMVRVLFGFSLRDTQCGFKLFKKHALRAVLDKVNTDEYAFDLELLVALRQNQFRIVDAPVLVLRQRNRGAVSVRSILTTFRDTIRIWKKARKGYYAS